MKLWSVLLSLALLIPASAQDLLNSHRWLPAGEITIRTSAGNPKIDITKPQLPRGEGVVEMELLRSTSDLHVTRDSHRFPIAQIPLKTSATFVLDNDPPEGVRVYYQLRIKTTANDTYWSNVVSTYIQPVAVDRIVDPNIVVDKTRFTLTLRSGDVPIRVFPIALGADCTNRKLHQDRASTPEGLYYISSLQPTATFYRAIDIDYPNETDRRRYEYHRTRGLLPKPTPPIGGEIQIHGDGIASNWTWGCMAMRNEDIDWLFRRPELARGLEVRIVGEEISLEDLDVMTNLPYTEFREIKDLLRTQGFLVGPSQDDWFYAVSLFQEKNSLPVTGILDRATRGLLLQKAAGGRRFGLLPRERGGVPPAERYSVAVARKSSERSSIRRL